MRNDFANFSTFFSSQVCNIPPIHVAAPSPQRIADALLTSRLCLSLPHIATPANGASEMRYSLETPFVRSAAEDAWGHGRPTPSALRRCATPPPARPRSADLIASRSSGGVRPRERSRLQLTPDSVGGHQPPQMRRRAPPLRLSCYPSTAAPPCGAYLPLHSIPGRAVRG